ncbi:MAG: TSUP family transporter [Verrucomicrobia bacterium]|nr:TSUP family transporter [Verrucomicrobiota bacterium]
MKTLILSVLVGVVSGLVAALCGVGGGVIMVPFFHGLLGLSQKQAVATSLAVIIPTAIVATVKNATSAPPLVVWQIVLAASAGAAITAWVASGWMQSLSNETLRRIFAVLLIVVGTKLLLSGPRG